MTKLSIKLSIECSHWFKALLLTGVLILLSACGNDDDASTASLVDPDAAVLDTLIVKLTGQAVVPAVTTLAQGDAAITVNPVSGAITGGVTVSRVVATAVSIRSGYAGENGVVVLTLLPDPVLDNNFMIPSGTVLSTDALERFQSGGLYITVATASRAEGIIRGQILRDDIRVYNTVLDGSSVVPEVTTTGSAKASVTVELATGQSVINVNVTELNASAVILQSGYAGENGDAEAGFLFQAVSGNPDQWRATGTLSPQQWSRLQGGQMYLSVQTASHINGEVRGQIVPDHISVLTTLLNGNQVVPQVTTTATAKAIRTYNADANTLAINIIISGLSTENITAVNLRKAYAGRRGPIVNNGTGGDPQSLSFTPLLNNGVASYALRLDGTDADGLLGNMPSASTISDMNAGLLYYNVETQAYSEGELRGQLLDDTFQLVISAVEAIQVSDPSGAGLMGSGVVSFTIDISSRETAAVVNLFDFTASSVTIGQGSAGVPVNALTRNLATDRCIPDSVGRTSLSLIDLGLLCSGETRNPLGEDPADASNPIVPGQQWYRKFTLSTLDLANFNSGKLAVIVDSGASTANRLRGQLLPSNIKFGLFNLLSANVIPVDPGSPVVAKAFVTANEATNAVVVNAYIVTNPVSSITDFLLRSGATGSNGSVIRSLKGDDALTFWQLESGLTGEDVSDLFSGNTYLQIETANNPSGAARIQVVF